MKETKNIQFLKTPDKIFGLEKSLLKMFLTPLVVIVLFLMSLGLVIIPKIGEIQANMSKITDLNLQIKLTNEKKSYLASVDLEQLNQEAEYLNKAVLKEKKSYLLVGVIRKIADSFGFQIKSFSVNPGEVKSGEATVLKTSTKDMATRMPLSVVLVGQSDKNLELIKALENSLPILFIDKFDSKTISGVSELEMTVSSYYVPDKSDYTSGNLTLSDLKLTDKESELLEKISQFGTVDGGVVGDDSGAEFVEYDRSDPFNL